GGPGMGREADTLRHTRFRSHMRGSAAPGAVEIGTRVPTEDRAGGEPRGTRSRSVVRRGTDAGRHPDAREGPTRGLARWDGEEGELDLRREPGIHQIGEGPSEGDAPCF